MLDLAQLEFIGSSGVRELVRAISAARRDGWSLLLDTHGGTAGTPGHRPARTRRPFLAGDLSSP
jgi:hypothetical protein